MLTRLDCSQTANHSLHLRPLSFLKFASTARNCGPRSVQRHWLLLGVPTSQFASGAVRRLATCLVLQADICKRRGRGKDTKKPQEMHCPFGWQCCCVASCVLPCAQRGSRVVPHSRSRAGRTNGQCKCRVCSSLLLAPALQFVSNHRPAVRQSCERRRQSGCDQ